MRSQGRHLRGGRQQRRAAGAERCLRAGDRRSAGENEERRARNSTLGGTGWRRRSDSRPSTSATASAQSRRSARSSDRRSKRSAKQSRAARSSSRTGSGLRTSSSTRRPEMQIRAVELEARETDWEYAPGRIVPGMGFNGTVPGPLIEAAVGDTIRARLTNSLSQPTTIHWHGLRVPASMDGTESVQAAVEPGGSFDYEFSAPDAGTFWYHTHVNETEQLERGLYGPLVVRGLGEPPLDAERVLMLDDLKLDADGQLSTFGDDHELHEGREGDIRLVNGAQEPELAIAGGQVDRWRIINAANTRFMRLSIGGRPFSILGSDGGLIEAPVEATEVLVTPGERGEPRRERFAP